MINKSAPVFGKEEAQRYEGIAHDLAADFYETSAQHAQKRQKKEQAPTLLQLKRSVHRVDSKSKSAADRAEDLRETEHARQRLEEKVQQLESGAGCSDLVDMERKEWAAAAAAASNPADAPDKLEQILARVPLLSRGQIGVGSSRELQELEKQQKAWLVERLLLLQNSRDHNSDDDDGDNRGRFVKMLWNDDE